MGRLFVATLEVAGFFLGGLGGGFGGLGGGCPPPAAAAAAAATGLPRPVRQPPPTPALRVHAPRTPARFPPTQILHNREGLLGVRPHHPAQLGDPHEARPPSATRHSTRTPRGSTPHVCTLTT